MDNQISIRNLNEKLTKCLEIIRKYDWLIDAYVLDFYVDDHWAKLPTAWRNHLEALPPEQLISLLNIDKVDIKEHCVWPLTLLALKQLVRDLCVARKPQEDMALSSTLTEHPKLRQVFTKCVKPKKQHEVQLMASVCKRCCHNTPVDFVVDFGAGLGHLARVLSYAHGIRVCCLEKQPQLNAQASAIDLQLETIAAKYLSPLEMNTFTRPTHVTLHLTSDTQTEELLSIIRESLQLRNDDFRFGIVGLHPCGDLATILMRIFLHCPQAKFLNLVGCCYMKLSTAAIRPNLEKLGYPLSKHLQQEQESQAHLSYEAREISCHAIEIYGDRLFSGNYEYLKVHSFRAAAERILIKQWPHLKRCGLRSVKHVPHMRFEDYFYKAVQGVIDYEVVSAELHTLQTTTDLLHWKRIVVFYTLRLMLAPLVESVILYDRMLFLMENDCLVEMSAIFDPRLSPRNHITTAVKQS